MSQAKTPALAAVLLLISGTWVLAQPAQSTSQARTRLRENIDTLLLVRMTEALDLSEEQAAKLYPALTKIEKEKGSLQAQLGTDIRDLRTLLQRTGVREADILDKVKRIREERLNIKQKDEAFEAVLDAELTPLQKAKYVIFTVDFYRGLGEAMTRAREMRGKIQRKP
jgi:Spy/CpxP family protein refolding chaperone